MTVPQARGRPTWGPVVTVCCLATLLGGAVAAAEPSATSAPSAAPVPAPPFEFAPTPLALPVANTSLDRQITALLRSFRDIQRSEVALSGEPGQNLSAQIVLQVRAGATLDDAMLRSLVTLIVSAVPGLAPERLNIASGDGTMLVAQGRVVATPRRTRSCRTGVILGVGLVALALLVAAGLWQPWRGRRRAVARPVDSLIGQHGDGLVHLLVQERPEIAGLVVSQASARGARWLARRLEAAGVSPRLPVRPADTRVTRLVLSDLQERLGAGR